MDRPVINIATWALQRTFSFSFRSTRHKSANGFARFTSLELNCVPVRKLKLFVSHTFGKFLKNTLHHSPFNTQTRIINSNIIHDLSRTEKMEISTS